MKHHLIPLAAALLALAAGCARAEDVERDAANEAYVLKVQQTCLEAARARGLPATKVERLSAVGNAQAELNARIAIKGGSSVTCRYNPQENSTTFPGLGDKRPEAGRTPVVKACRDVADQKDIRLGDFDSLKEIDGRKLEVKFDRALLGRRHTCVYDPRAQTVAFDGGKPVAAPPLQTPK